MTLNHNFFWNIFWLKIQTNVSKMKVFFVCLCCLFCSNHALAFSLKSCSNENDNVLVTNEFGNVLIGCKPDSEFRNCSLIKDENPIYKMLNDFIGAEKLFGPLKLLNDGFQRIGNLTDCVFYSDHVQEKREIQPLF